MKRCMGCMETYDERDRVCPYCGYVENTSPKEAYHMVPGSILNKRYIVGQVLGFGGFGVTYVGWDALLETKVAIKEFLPGEFATRVPGQTVVTVYSGERQEQFEAGIKKFVDEAQMLAKFQNTPGIAHIYNSFQENNTAYIIMEYLEGETLKDRLMREKKIDPQETLNIVLPLISALKEVHKVGILHRDIAPDNIYLTKDGEVRLIDFGASRFATTTHSKSLSVIIKQGYAPEEQYRSRGDQGPWTDVYALAATMYNMITGVRPDDAMERAIRDEVKEPSKLGIKLPKNMETAIMNALNIKIENRTQSMDQFEAELLSQSEVKRIIEIIKHDDVGRWPLWAKILVPALLGVSGLFVVLMLTGIIQFDVLTSKAYTVADGMTKVPSIVNMSETEATDRLTAVELGIQIIDKQYSDVVAASLVLNQDIDGGKEVSVGTDIQVIISAGKEQVYMPGVVGISLEEARKQLEELGLQVEVEEIFSGLAVGAVVSQNVEADERVETGSIIRLQVSKGLENVDENAIVMVPNLLGQTFDNAKSLLEDMNLYIEREDAVYSSSVPAGQIISQSEPEGTEVKSGTAISVVVSLGVELVRVPDVQYKDELQAVESVINVGLQVNIQREYSETVATGKIIRQSLKAGTQVERGKEIILYVSMGRKESQTSTEVPTEAPTQAPTEAPTQPVVKEWSGWMTELPAGVGSDKYEIETKTQYRYRDKSTTTSTSSSMPGWTLESSETSYSDWGAWSEWSQTARTENKTTNVEKATWYSYRDREYTESSSSSKEGWEQYKKTESWGSWSAWSDTPVSGSSTRNVETRQVDDPNNPITKTQYKYSRYKILGSDGQWHFGPTSGSISYWGGSPTYEENGWLDSPLAYEGMSNAGVPKYAGTWYNEQTQVVTIGYNQKTQYRYQDKYYTYYYRRWGSWSAFSPNAVSQTADREVRTAVYYRYRTRNEIITYHFYQWSNWTEYNDTAVNASNTREVQTRIMYRYKPK